MFRGRADYPVLARIITASARGEGDERVETTEALASAYDHFERCDPTRDLLIAELAGLPVAYSRVTWDDEVDGPRVYRQVCFVDPEYGRRGIGSALLTWNEARLREIAGDHEVEDSVFESWAGDQNEAATALIRSAGYEAITYMAEMVRPSVADLPDHVLPDGLEIRPVREEDIRTIWEADHEAFRDHWGYVESSEAATSASARSRTSTRPCGRSRGTSRVSPARSSRSSIRRRTRSSGGSAGGPRPSRRHGAGAARASRRR